MVSIGFVVSLFILLVFPINSIQALVLALAPLLITAVLVIPIPHYHNVYTVLKELIEFFYKRRNYKWEGWCTKDEFK
jgi:hypothetical protein